jgi:hypothetical protein
LDPNTTLTHILGKDDLNHISKNYLQDVEVQVKVATAHALDDFHVSNVNIDFGLVQEVNVKTQVRQ